MSRPVLLAGYGIRLAGLADQFIPFIERLNIPVLTTWKGADLIPEDHPLFFGRPGCIASKYANMIIQNCDYLLALGARLDLPSVGYDWINFAPKAHKVFKNDLKELAVPDCFEGDNHQAWLDQCAYWKEQYPLGPSWVDRISDECKEGETLVPSSSGMACESVLQRFKVKRGQRIVFFPGLGSMGFALPAAIGAACASGGRVVCVEGDGSLQHNIQELATIKALNLPIKLFILLNDGYASIRNTQRSRFGRFLGCDPAHGLPMPDIRKVVESYGVEAEYIAIDPASEIHPRLHSTMDKHGRISPGRLEDIS